MTNISSHIVAILLESEEDDPKELVIDRFDSVFDTAAMEAYSHFMNVIATESPALNRMLSDPATRHDNLWRLIKKESEAVKQSYALDDDDVHDINRMLMAAWQEREYGTRSSSLDKLREAEEEIDPKEFVSRPDVMYHHEVWQVSTKDIRKLLAEQGWRVLSAVRRRRGSLALVVKGNGRDDIYSQVHDVNDTVQVWLDTKFNVGGRGSPFVVKCFPYDQDSRFGPYARLYLEIFKSEHDDVAKFGEGPHPYA